MALFVRTTRSLLVILLALSISAGVSAQSDCPNCPFGISQVYSNADGSIQYLQIWQFAPAEASLLGKPIVVNNGAYDEFEVTFFRPPKWPNAPVLMATASFARLGLVEPDIIVPDRFLPLHNGSILIDGVKLVHYQALPIDGFNSIYPNLEGDPYARFAREIVDTAVAVNNAGQFHVFDAPSKLTGLWWNLAEPGWGLAVEHQDRTMLALWATHDERGEPTWLALQALRWDLLHPEYALLKLGEPNIYLGSVYRTTGTPYGGFGTAPLPPEEIGSVEFDFHRNEGVAAFRINLQGRAGKPSAGFSKIGSPAVYATPVPVCVDGPALPSNVNFQGLWWNAADPGWGLHLMHQGDVIFAIWFTYDDSGQATWLSMTANRGATNAYEGTLFHTKGPAYDTGMNDASAVTHTSLGKGKLSFGDALHGTFSYKLRGARREASIERQAFGAASTHCE